MVMKRIALLERLAGDRRTALERELLEPPRERNGTERHGTGRNGTGIARRKTAVQRTGNGNFLLTPTVYTVWQEILTGNLIWWIGG